MAPDSTIATDGPATTAELRRERRKLRKRREFAHAALLLFQQRGFDATSVEELAQAAEYSYSTFFRHFDRKEDVLFYDFPERLATLRHEFRDGTGSTVWQSARRAFVANAADWASDEPEFQGARLRMIHQEPALFARFLGYCLEWEAVIATELARERDADPATDLHSRLVAGAAVCGFRAAIIAGLANPNVDLPQQVDAALDEVERGLVRGGP
jgi:AcrR family transcriptional regulator